MPDTFWTPQVVAAVAGLGGVVVGSLISWGVHLAFLASALAPTIALAERRFSFKKELAERRFKYDRALHDHRRRTELAEEVLADFYQARDIMQAARSPGGFGDEGNTRSKEPWETEDDTRLLNSYFRTFERLNNKSEFFSQLNARRYRFLALFGQEAITPYDEFFRIRADIIVAVRMLVTQHQPNPRGEALENRRMWKTTIGWPHSQPDPIELRLNQVIAGIEKICRPLIQEIAE